MQLNLLMCVNRQKIKSYTPNLLITTQQINLIDSLLSASVMAFLIVIQPTTKEYK